MATTVKDTGEDHRNPSAGGATGWPPASTLPIFYIIHFFSVVAMTDTGKVPQAEGRKLRIVAQEKVAGR